MTSVSLLVVQRIEEAAVRGELTELVLLVIWNRLDLARRDVSLLIINTVSSHAYNWIGVQLICPLNKLLLNLNQFISRMRRMQSEALISCTEGLRYAT